MVDDATRREVRALLDAVREQPTELPFDRIVQLSRRPVRVSVDREGPEPVVFVTPRPDRRFEALSRRESEVATLVAAGFSNRQIGAALFISVGTVKDHVHAILAKTGLASRSAVAACWYSPPAGLDDPDPADVRAAHRTLPEAERDEPGGPG